jgi:hypothetical protein
MHAQAFGWSYLSGVPKAKWLISCLIRLTRPSDLLLKNCNKMVHSVIILYSLAALNACYTDNLLWCAYTSFDVVYLTQLTILLGSYTGLK